MMNKTNRILYWSPRVLAILFIIFMALMSLDVITPEASIWEIICGMFMHNIPTMVMIVVLIVAWKREIVGGIVFILAGVAYIILTATSGLPWYIVLSWSFTIAGPAFLIGVLFLVNWYKKKKNVQE
jgi:hypothetical protein